MHMLRKESDFEAFERVMVEAHLRQPIRILRCGSLWSRTRGTDAIKALLSPLPVERPANWTARVNAPLTTKELDRVRVSIERGRPYGEEKWVSETVRDLGLEQTVRPDFRPRKRANRRPRREANYADCIQRSDSSSNYSRPCFLPIAKLIASLFPSRAARGATSRIVVGMA
jgi:hypothetical protein